MWSLQKYHQLKLSRQTRSPRAEGTCAKDEDPWKDTDAESSPGANGGGLGTTAQRHFDLHDAITEKELGGASTDEVTASDAFHELISFPSDQGAIRIITEAQAEQLRREAEQKGIMFDRIPAKAIFQRKAGTGKRKCRACACGNFMTKRPLADTYAAGTGAAEVRAIWRMCGLRSWSAVTLDVKIAFLSTPKDQSNESVIVQPPQSLHPGGGVSAWHIVARGSSTVWADR